MKDFKIHCSAISKIMAGNIGLTDVQTARFDELFARSTGNGKPLTPNIEKELSELMRKKMNPELPQGAKTYLKSWLKRELFNRKQDWKAIVIEKGLQVEQQGIDLVNAINGLDAVKNEQYFGNDFMQGTPDIILEDCVRDIKSSWELFTFPMFDDSVPNEDYYWQLQGYMILTGKRKAHLDYVLIDTPMPLILQDLKKLYFQSGGAAEDWYPEAYEFMYTNYRFGDIPDDKRIKTYSFDFEEGISEKIEQRVGMCREYLNQLIERN
jgi:hypothetical protein